MRELLLSHAPALVRGFIGQVFSSLTNFGLTLMAGRLLGPSGLGVVFLGFAAYLVALGLHRAVVVEPLVAASAVHEAGERARTSAKAITLSLLFAGIATVSVLVVSGVVSGPRAEGLRVIAPWLAPAILQDLCRSLLFRDGRATAAATNDAVWLGAMVLALPLPLFASSTAWVTAWWGIGATCAAAAGLVQLSVRPERPGASLRWWRAHAWPFGRWVAAATATANTLSNLTIFFLSSLLGAAAVGGLRAAEAVFSPLTLVIPALSLPGLPALVRARAEAPGTERRLAVGLSGVAVAAAAAYLLVLALGGWRLLVWLFGADFSAFTALLVPIAVAQVLSAVGVGSMVLIKAQRRGPVVLLNRAVGSAATLVAALVLAGTSGVTGAAWGLAVGALVSSTLVTVTALRYREPPSVAGGRRAAQARDRPPSTTRA